MAKKSNWKGFRVRALSDENLLNRFSGDLEELENLTRQYDSGYTQCYSQMAIVIHRALTENRMGIRERGSRAFHSSAFAVENVTDHPSHRLIAIQFRANPPGINFVPHFQAGLLEQKLTFRRWWNEIVFKPGPVHGLDAHNLPSEKNQSLNRRQLVAAVRHKIAAHQETEMLAILEDLEKAFAWGLVELRIGDTSLSTADPNLEVVTPPLRAMMRELAHEVLLAFDRLEDR